jgi:hypothetical protein
MSATSTALNDVKTKFAQEIGRPINKPTSSSLDRIFDLTLGPFIDQGLRFGQDVWKIQKFKRWNLIQVAKIARESQRHAKSGPITSKIVQQAAVKVMRVAQKQCNVTYRNGRIVHIPGDREQGDVCDTFLAMHK